MTGDREETMLPEQLLSLLGTAYRGVDEKLRHDFDRSLPLQDAIDDRWERAKRLGFGDGTSIYNSVFVFGDVRVGKKTWIGPYVILEGASGGITIGDTCSISAGVHIYTHDTIAWALSGGEMEARQGAVHIGSRTYIGSQSIIAAGVTIGSGCVIAANSFINGDQEEGTIVGGSPARRLGQVEFRNNQPVLVFDNGKETPLGKQDIS